MSHTDEARDCGLPTSMSSKRPTRRSGPVRVGRRMLAMAVHPTPRHGPAAAPPSARGQVVGGGFGSAWGTAGARWG